MAFLTVERMYVCRKNEAFSTSVISLKIAHAIRPIGGYSFTIEVWNVIESH